MCVCVVGRVAVIGPRSIATFMCVVRCVAVCSELAQRANEYTSVCVSCVCDVLHRPISYVYEPVCYVR